MAIMQPYFLPYLGYFQLMASVNTWVFFDDVQFVNKGWVNRNRVLHPTEANVWQYITVPLRNKNRFDHIKDIQIAGDEWLEKIVGQLSFLKRRAPFHREAIELLRECCDASESSLASLNIRSLRKLAAAFSIAPDFITQSEEGWQLGKVAHPGQWALRICRQVGASRYLNPEGGRALFDEGEYRAVGIDIGFHEACLLPYEQKRDHFVEGLSIIDCVCWNGIDGTKRLIAEGVV